MALPKNVIDYINDSALREGCDYPKPNINLFDTGILDSFGLVDFVSLIEEHCDIVIPDEDIKLDNFQNLETLEQYINSRKESN